MKIKALGERGVASWSALAALCLMPSISFGQATLLANVSGTVEQVQKQAIGHYESNNVRWGVAPLQGQLINKEAMHYSPYSDSNGDGYMSTSFFPQNDLQIADLYQMSFNVYFPYGSHCADRSVYMWLVLESPEGAQESVRVYPKIDAMTAPCHKNRWIKLDFVNDAAAQWELSSTLGGDKNLTRTQAHDAIVENFAADYRIYIVRMNGVNVGPDMWVHNEVINGQTFYRATDFNSETGPENALLPDSALVPPFSEVVSDPESVLPGFVNLPTLGRYQTRNVRWTQNVPDSGSFVIKQGLHFAPYTHPENEGFMSVTFFPDTSMQLTDLEQMAFNFRLAPGSAATSSSPRIQIEFANEAGERTQQYAYIYRDFLANMNANRWYGLDYGVASLTRWAAGGIGGSNSGTQQSSHDAAVAAFGQDYSIYAIRIQADDAAIAEAWFHLIQINGFKLTQANDWSVNALLPDADLGPVQ